MLQCCCRCQPRLEACGASAPRLNYSPAIRSVPNVSRTRARTVVRATQESDPGANLARDFSKFVNEKGAPPPLHNRRPSHLLPPTAAIAAQLDALQLNDWPDRAAGIHTAFLFSKPYGCEEMVTGPPLPSHARSWHGKEEWLSLEEFTSMLQSQDYKPLINCESWQATSPMVFPSTRAGTKAVQAVQVTSQPSAGISNAKRSHTFTFCLEHVTQGPYKLKGLVHYLSEIDMLDIVCGGQLILVTTLAQHGIVQQQKIVADEECHDDMHFFANNYLTQCDLK